ncbi:MFS transporter [Plantactinospora sp. GCM10030261]|uniref:MFS transporter n=1 Tax=Plantactinospora sp. GCM10030261 TaxID=3273420 RepID=UPI003619914E
MRGTWRQLRSFDRCLRLLLLNQFGINLGCYLLMPYLANHLADGLGMAAWTVGLVLGVRALSDQGLFLIGGLLADRLGFKPLIMIGCALRTAGFAALGFVTALPMLLAAAVATGLAGALFGPAVRAYLAAEAGDRRIPAFALFNVFYQAGVLIGPVLGLVLVGVSFRAVCLTAAAIFGVLTVLQARVLPARPPDPPRQRGPGGVRVDCAEVLGNRAFLRFSLAMLGSHVLAAQIYLALPLQAARELGDGGAVGSGALFALSAVVAVVGQVRVTGRLRQRWSAGRAIAVGLALMATAFLPVAATASGSGRNDTGTAAALALLPVLAATALLTMGTVVAYPFEMDALVALSRDRLLATHYGLHNTLAGLGIAAGNLATGVLWELGDRWATPALSWLALTAVGMAGATAVALLARSWPVGTAVPPGSLGSTGGTAAQHLDQRAVA